MIFVRRMNHKVTMSEARLGTEPLHTFQSAGD